MQLLYLCLRGNKIAPPLRHMCAKEVQFYHTYIQQFLINILSKLSRHTLRKRGLA